MTEVTNKLNIDPSLLTHLVQITEKMKVDLQQVNSRMNVLEQKVKHFSSWNDAIRLHKRLRRILKAQCLENEDLEQSKKKTLSSKYSESFHTYPGLPTTALTQLTGVLFPSHSHHYLFSFLPHNFESSLFDWK